MSTQDIHCMFVLGFLLLFFCLFFFLFVFFFLENLEKTIFHLCLYEIGFLAM